MFLFLFFSILKTSSLFSGLYCLKLKVGCHSYLWFYVMCFYLWSLSRFFSLSLVSRNLVMMCIDVVFFRTFKTWRLPDTLELWYIFHYFWNTFIPYFLKYLFCTTLSPFTESNHVLETLKLSYSSLMQTSFSFPSLFCRFHLV